MGARRCTYIKVNIPRVGVYTWRSFADSFFPWFFVSDCYVLGCSECLNAHWVGWKLSSTLRVVGRTSLDVSLGVLGLIDGH
jgi:hypothetical protein